MLIWMTQLVSTRDSLTKFLERNVDVKTEPYIAAGYNKRVFWLRVWLARHSRDITRENPCSTLLLSHILFQWRDKSQIQSSLRGYPPEALLTYSKCPRCNNMTFTTMHRFLCFSLLIKLRFLYSFSGKNKYAITFSYSFDLTILKVGFKKINYKILIVNLYISERPIISFRFSYIFTCVIVFNNSLQKATKVNSRFNYYFRLIIVVVVVDSIAGKITVEDILRLQF